MCVICHALKKKHIKRAEIVEAMRINSAGFFGAALHPDGKRDTIRSLDEKDLLKFFDEVVRDDDAFVMHARIPSYGATNLENVHGWEEDGIIFMHNMSLHNLDTLMDKHPDWKGKTDSEFFFRKVFLPFFRGYGKDAYKDGKFHPDIDKFVEWICGSGNRFLFIMPDNVVLRYGTWVSESDRKEGEEVAFYASNASYKVYQPPKVVTTTPTWRAGDYYGSYSSWYDTDAELEEPDMLVSDGKDAIAAIGYGGVAKIVFDTMVIDAILAIKAESQPDIELFDINTRVSESLRELWNEDYGYSADDLPADDNDREAFLMDAAKCIEECIHKDRVKSFDPVLPISQAITRYVDNSYEPEIALSYSVLNTCVRWDKAKLSDALFGMILRETMEGTPYMSNVTPDLIAKAISEANAKEAKKFLNFLFTTAKGASK